MRYDDIRLTSDFEFQLSRIPAHDEDTHIHDMLELCIVLDNRINCRFNDRWYEGQPGDVFVCRPFEPHWGHAVDSGESPMWVILLFSPAVVRHVPRGYRLLVPFYSRLLPSPVIPASTAHARAIQAATRLAVQAQQQAGPVAEAKQFALLIQILLSVFEFMAETREIDFHGDDTHSISGTICRMLQHYREDLPVEQYWKESGRKRSAFYQSFHQFTGVSPTEFLHRLRVQAAMDLLSRSSNANMTDIAFESGFPSLSTFNKQFKRYTGMAPRAFRERS